MGAFRSMPMSLIAVTADDVRLYGCPNCNVKIHLDDASTNPSIVSTVCGVCDSGINICYNGMVPEKSGMQIGFRNADGTEERHTPKLVEHPRKFMRAWTREHPHPENFSPRGIGRDETPGCFVCGGKKDLYHNIAAFVSNREAGERVVQMFPFGARLDFRPSTPYRVQVKIGACDAHLPVLEQLGKVTYDAGRAISSELIRRAFDAAGMGGDMHDYYRLD